MTAPGTAPTARVTTMPCAAHAVVAPLVASAFVGTTLVVPLLCASAAFAHGIAPDEHPASLASLPWSRDWLVWLLLLASLALYLRGLRRVLSTASASTGPLHRRDAACFAAGWLAAFVALASPLHPWGQMLFSAHMLQHELLMVVAAPLLVLGRPLVAFSRAIPPLWLLRLFGASGRLRPLRPLWQLLTLPLTAWSLHAIALWVWHLPLLFEATLHSELVHSLQHLSFFGSALLFWWALLRRRSDASGYGAAVLYLFTTSAHSGALGALLTLATRSLYPAYAATAPRWGMTVLEDQQLGGLLMWIPAGLVYAGAALLLLLAWMRDSERRARTREHAIASRRAERGPDASARERYGRALARAAGEEAGR